MNFLQDKKQLVFILFIVAVILIGLNIVSAILFPAEPPEPEVKELSTEEVSGRFKNAILSYGFDEQWITEKKKSGDEKSYLIKVPKDLPIALLIKEIRDSYLPEEAEIIVEEKKINGANYLKIISNGNLKLTSDFSYNADILRPTGSAGTIIMDIDKAGESEMKNILRTPQLSGAVLIPSKASAALSRRITDERKELIIMLNDNIYELEYKLASGFSEKRLKDVLRTIMGAFPKAAFYIIDSQSSLYNSPAGKFIINEFTKRNMKIIPSSDYVIYNAEGGKNFSEIVRSSQDNKKLIAIPAAVYTSLYPEFDKLRKIGFKFVNPSTVIK
jgi:hypothetical protein